MRVQAEAFKTLVLRASFALNGDGYEINYGHYLAQSFPNCERFWQQFVVPFTTRVEGYPDELKQELKVRDNISPKIRDIGNAHYSAFLHLLYARVHLGREKEHMSWVSDFYTHLASVCDLIEMVLEKWYVLRQECMGENVQVLRELGKDDFIELASQWYDNHYPNTYKHYLSKGKFFPIKVPNRENILEEYLGTSGVWKMYIKQSQPIRTFRNAVVHNLEVGKLYVNDKVYIPKPELIGQLQDWDKLFTIPNVEELNKKCVLASERMSSDILQLENVLNTIWEQILLRDFQAQFYSPTKSSLREMYDIQFE